MSFREHRKNRGREQKKEFVKRLQYAMNWAGVGAMELSRRMLQYEQYPEYMDALQIKHLDERNKACNDIAASRLQLITDLRDPDTTMPDSLTIQSLSMALGCSADYLLGIIDVPTHEIKTVQEITHLSNDTVQKLIDFHFSEDTDMFLGFLLGRQQKPGENSPSFGCKTYFGALAEYLYSLYYVLKGAEPSPTPIVSTLSLITSPVVQEFELILVEYISTFCCRMDSDHAYEVIRAYHDKPYNFKIIVHKNK